MFAIILKDIRIYTNTRKYRLIQYVILIALALLLFSVLVDFYAQGIDKQQEGIASDVGKRTYSIMIICLLIMQFIVINHGVAAFTMERASLHHKERNWVKKSSYDPLLGLTPLHNWRIVVGKMAAVVFWTLWGIWLIIPLFVLSYYVGGLDMIQLVKCGTVILGNIIFFTIIGMSIAQWFPPTPAKGISYGLVLTLTFLPQFPISPFNNITWFNVLSPLSAMFSILGSAETYLWVWHVCLICILCFISIPILVRQMR